MTKSVTICNTSNWEGENLSVMESGYITELKPGGKMQIHPRPDPDGGEGDLHISVYFEDNKYITPFKDEHGDQVFPKVNVEFTK